MVNVLSNLEPKPVFHNFGDLSKVPRPSKKEGKIVAYMENWAKEKNINLRKDATGNSLVQTSTNFAIVETLEDGIKVTTSQRSSVDSEKMNVHEEVNYKNIC